MKCLVGTNAALFRENNFILVTSKIVKSLFVANNNSRIYFKLLGEHTFFSDKFYVFIVSSDNMVNNTPTMQVNKSNKSHK